MKKFALFAVLVAAGMAPCAMEASAEQGPSQGAVYSMHHIDGCKIEVAQLEGKVVARDGIIYLARGSDGSERFENEYGNLLEMNKMTRPFFSRLSKVLNEVGSPDSLSDED